MRSFLDRLGGPLPVLAAPMAGGPTTPGLVTAAARAGGFGFLAGGYLSAAALADQLAAVRADTDAFGVNLFAPNPVPVDPSAYRQYADAIRVEADRLGVELPVEPVEDDDHWAEKLALLSSEPVPLVSFTFGVPDAAAVGALRRVGTLLAQTVTSAAEARVAAAAGMDALVVQALAAGGHCATFTPDRIPPPTPITDLVREIRAVTDLPVIAAGGLASAADVEAVLAAGADAAMVGTVLLRATESGTSAPYRAALAAARDTATLLTRAFTGRPARALPNDFLARYDALAPSGYPAVHYLTRPIRRAAVSAGDPDRINLWAGTGYAAATAEPAGAILNRLVSRA